MWICLNDGFISVVQFKNDPNTLLVRARKKRDLENIVGPNHKIKETPDRDYRFRTTLHKEVFKSIMMERIDGIDYTNFKNSVADDALHDLYASMWHEHWTYQNQSERGNNDSVYGDTY